MRSKMSQIKIYALKTTIDLHRNNISRAVHSALVKILEYPEEKIFQRFIALEAENFIFPQDRSQLYTIIEISMFEGRTIETKKLFIKAILDNIHDLCGFEFNDIEVTIFETPKENWGIRGKNADDLQLNYKVQI